MKTIITLLLAVFAMAASAQNTSGLIAEQIFIELDGTVVSEKKDLTHISVAASVSDYYNNDRIKRNVRYVADRYSDVEIAKSWRITDRGHIEAVLKVVDAFVLVTYDDTRKLIIITYAL